MSDGTVVQNDAKAASKPKPALPDGRGLKYADIRAMLAEKHGVGVTLDDPILMLVSILNVYLGEFQDAHQAYNKALGDILADRTQEHIAKVQETAEQLEKAVSETSINAVKAVFMAHDASLRRHNICMLWLTGVMVLAAAGVILKGFLY